MKINHLKKTLSGFGLIESLLTITLFVIIAGVFSSAYYSVNQASVISHQSTRADRILSESIEAIRSIRDQNYLFLQNGPHGLSYSGNRWLFNGSSDLVNGQFTRVITISSVYRDQDGNMTSTGGTIDERTKAINIFISWTSPYSGTQSISSDYTLSDSFAFDNITSNTSQWDDGEYNDTISVDTGDGSINLDSYVESWENSINNTTYLYEENENANARSVDIVGNLAYIVGTNNGQTPNFRILDVSDPDNVVKLGDFNTGTNINDIWVVGNYAYLATGAQSAELQIVDISNPTSLSVTASINLTDNKGAYSLFYDETSLYMGMNTNSSSEFYIFSLSNPTSPSIIGQMEIGGPVHDIDVENQQAFLATETSMSLRILNVSNPASITTLSQTSSSPENKSIGVDFRDGKVYVGSKKSPGDSELKVYDASNPSSLVLLGSLEINDQINDVEVYGTYAFVSTNRVNHEFMVVDITTPSTLSVLSAFDMGGDGNKMFVNATGVYVTSEDNDSPFYIFTMPQEVYYTSGSYNSEAIDSGSDTTSWQSFYWDGVLQSNTAIQIQLRTANTEANLSSALWVGSDGTNSTSYDQQINTITTSPVASGTRWLQYKVDFSGDGNYTPEIYSVRFQYAP